MASAVVFAYHDVGVRCLSALLARGVRVPLVLTHEDNPAEAIWFGSVKHLCQERGIPFLTPDDPLEALERIRALYHVVQRRARFRFAVENRPVDGRAPAILRQQRTVHVERTPACLFQECGIQHAPVIEREQKIRTHLAQNALETGLLGVLRRQHGNAIVASCAFHAREPLRFRRVGRMSDDERHFDSLRDEHAQAPIAHVVVAEDDGASCHCPET